MVRAMQLKNPGPVDEGPLAEADLTQPAPGPKEILVRVGVCGVCHTDLHTVEGELDLPKLPVVPGHQVVGVVEETAEGANRFEPGERVGLAWLYDTCGDCRFCESARENLCPKARFTGLNVNGGYAEYVKVKEDFAYPIPQGYQDHEAAPLLCAGIIGYRALRLSGIAEGGRLGLYGFGASAHLAIQIARHWGCEVYVYTRTQSHRDLAEELGAVWVGGAEDDPPQKMDSSIIFAPAGPLVPRAMEQLDKGGRLALAGIYMTPIPEMDYTRHLYHERSITSVANSTRQDGEELMSLAGEIRIQTHTEVFPLEEANRVLQKLKKSDIEASAVLQIG